SFVLRVVLQHYPCNQLAFKLLQSFQSARHVVYEDHVSSNVVARYEVTPDRKNSRPSRDGSRPTSTDSCRYRLSKPRVRSRYSHKSGSRPQTPAVSLPRGRSPDLASARQRRRSSATSPAPILLGARQGRIFPRRQIAIQVADR